MAFNGSRKGFEMAIKFAANIKKDGRGRSGRRLTSRSTVAPHLGLKFRRASLPVPSFTSPSSRSTCGLATFKSLLNCLPIHA